eukprot:6305468-Karenia_brevis.AAC.1
MLRLCLSFLLQQIGKGPLVFSCEEFDEKKKQLHLFTDAMAEDGRAAIGGWMRHESGRRELSSWFHYEFTEEKEPWIFDKGRSQLFRKIATLELLG